MSGGADLLELKGMVRLTLDVPKEHRFIGTRQVVLKHGSTHPAGKCEPARQTLPIVLII